MACHRRRAGREMSDPRGSDYLIILPKAGSKCRKEVLDDRWVRPGIAYWVRCVPIGGPHIATGLPTAAPDPRALVWRATQSASSVEDDSEAPVVNRTSRRDQLGPKPVRLSDSGLTCGSGP